VQEYEFGAKAALKMLAKLTAKENYVEVFKIR
jgi:hypothetical protein